MNTVRELLKRKDNNVWSVTPKAMVLEALELMAEKNIGALLVLDQGKLVGIFSERDYARKVRLKGRSSTDTPIDELMTREIVSVSPDEKIKECMELMTTRRIRHLPVFENERLVGVITIGDLVKRIITDQEVAIRELENYITGSY